MGGNPATVPDVEASDHPIRAPRPTVTRSAAATVLLALSLASCGGSSGPAGGAERDDDAASFDETSGDGPVPTGEWVLDADAAGIDVGDGRITLSIAEDTDGDADTDAMGGTAACNGYGGSMRIDLDQLAIEEFSLTEMGCEEPLQSAESAYVDRLLAMTAFTVAPDGARLTLTGDGDELVFGGVVEVEEVSLVGTEWTVDTVLSGDTASSVPTGARQAVFRFDEDGTFTLFTGCRDFEGEWSLTGDTLQVPSSGVVAVSRGVGADGELTCSDEAVTLEDAVLTVFGSGTAVELDGDRLMMMIRGQGISALG